MKSALHKIAVFVLFAGAGAGILLWLYRKLSKSYALQCAEMGLTEDACSLWQKLWTDFASVDFFWLGMVLVAFMWSNVLRAWRWQMLVRPMGYRMRFWSAFYGIMLGYFANLGLPRVGEIVRAGAVARMDQLPIEVTLGTTVTDRILDVLMLVIFLLFGLWLEFDVLMQWLAYGFDALFGRIDGVTGLAAGSVLLAIALTHHQWKKWKLVQTLLGRAKGFIRAMLSLRHVEQPVRFGVYTVGIWLMYFLMMWFCLYSYEPTRHLGPKEAFVTFDFGALGMIAPFPGGMGSFHFMVMQALKHYGIDEISAFSYSMINFFSVQIFCNVLFGLIALAYFGWKQTKSLTES